MKTVDTGTYVSTLRELTEAGQEVSLVISGSSMAPFLCHGRDSVLFRKPDLAVPLRRGDVVFYQRAGGQFVLHRITRVRPEGLYLVGDAQTTVEGPIQPSQVFAIVTQVCRKGTWIGPESCCWRFFQRIWIRLVPLRPLLLRCYGLLSRFRKKYRPSAAE